MALFLNKFWTNSLKSFWAEFYLTLDKKTELFRIESISITSNDSMLSRIWLKAANKPTVNLKIVPFLGFYKYLDTIDKDFWHILVLFTGWILMTVKIFKANSSY